MKHIHEEPCRKAGQSIHETANARESFETVHIYAVRLQHTQELSPMNSLRGAQKATNQQEPLIIVFKSARQYCSRS
jgi:hypothetical protein